MAHDSKVFEALYRADQRPPWDLDGPTPFVQHLESQGAFKGRILDAGCGTGENALYLGSRGHAVVGIDAAPTAIARARARAEQRQLLSVTVLQADACEIPGFTDAFNTVLDCGFFHVLSPEDQRRYVTALKRATKPGAVLHLMAFSDRNPPRSEHPPKGCFTHGVSETELRNAFSPEWDIESLQEVRSTLGGNEVQFWQACLKRKEGPSQP